MTVEERMAGLLDTKDAELDKLRTKIEELLDKLDDEKWRWARHTRSKDDALPVPRLEIRYHRVSGTWRNPDAWETKEARYNLVYRHLDGDIVTVPLENTKIEGGTGEPPVVNGEVVLPYRDGAHIYHEMMTLGLPGFSICGDVVTDLGKKDPGYSWYKPHQNAEVKP